MLWIKKDDKAKREAISVRRKRRESNGGKYTKKMSKLEREREREGRRMRGGCASRIAVRSRHSYSSAEIIDETTPCRSSGENQPVADSREERMSLLLDEEELDE